jgi:DAK2 domain fusion protein YloV
MTDLPRVQGELRVKLANRYQVVNGRVLLRMTEAGATWLRTHQQIVNALNVFPVPDGDTGTNMVLTMDAALQELADQDERSISKVAQSIAHGALMGARGNSGVILSQLWRGFARALDELEEAHANELVEALVEARDTAYRGVVRPVEGTILTVSTDVASAAEDALENGAASALDILESVVRAAEDSVEHTPELLPVLKEAGVVDSGGKGLYLIFDGMLRSVYGEALDVTDATVVSLSEIDLESAEETIEPGQDWEVVVDFRPKGVLDLDSFYSKLDEMGTSIQVGEGEGMYRMHIHVPDTTEYLPIDYIRDLGTVTNVAIENLMDQMASKRGAAVRLSLEEVKPGQIGSIVVAPGDGLAQVFASLGASAIISGGQTMNPSTEEILKSVEELPAEQVLILPNNKNIILAAQQAANMSEKDVRVIPCTSVPQGISAMLGINPDGRLDEVVEVMSKSILDVKSVELTVATRSVVIDEVEVRKGQTIGLLDGKLAIASSDLESGLLGILEKVDIENAELITFYNGEDLSTSEADDLAELVRKRWTNLEVEVLDGGQPYYPLILSVE